MSEIQTIELAARAAEEPTGQPTTGRFLFSSWHLVLIPIAVVMVIPLVWMLVTSLQTLDETRHYPPTIVADVAPSSGTTPTCSSRLRSPGGSSTRCS